MARTTFGLGLTQDDSNPEGHREVFQNEKEEQEPLLKLTADIAGDRSIALVDYTIGQAGLPQLFRKLNEPLALPEFDPYRCRNTGYETSALETSDITEADLALSPDLEEFLLSFLRRDDSDPGLSQFLSIRPTDGPFEYLPDERAFSGGVDVTAKIGTIQLGSTVGLKFRLNTFSFEANPDGIKFFSTKDEAEFLGLTFKFAKKGDEESEEPFHLFTLQVKNSNYALELAEGASVKAEFGEATEKGSPIVFEVEKFRVGPRGLSLTANVSQSPAKLNGVGEKFRFRGGTLSIVDNRIEDFSMSGDGALPPDLVGPSRAKVTLSFGQRDGALRLLAGEAKLEGNKLLKCTATRFHFQLDGIGLRFVYDNGYHFWFTLTGMARYVPLANDDGSGPLAWLPGIELQLIDCPLTKDVSVLKKHVKFLIELPEKKVFPFLGCFEFELRGIGFVPSAEPFDGDGAMELSGQIKFSDAGDDVVDVKVDFHRLLVGLPEPGSLIPRIYARGLGITIRSGGALEVSGFLDYVDGKDGDGLEARGFRGKGSIMIQGLPKIAVSFAFLRVSADEGITWQRAWFLYVEARRLSLKIPVLEIYLREVGLGFGYRYTLVSIKKADEEDDVGNLIKELKVLSRSQGELHDFKQWTVDLDSSGKTRWTLVARAMLAQSTSSPSDPVGWDEKKEKDLPCFFLLDGVFALRSDLTFLFTSRAWVNTNYYDFDSDVRGLRTKPLFSGFVLLSPRKKRFLAHLASNPNAEFGDHPPMPNFLKRAIKNSRFSATLLLEPGLFHSELGWPNMLQWKDKLGPVEAEFRGGCIFRVSSTELVVGNSFLAKGKLHFRAGLSFGIGGASLSATAHVAYGARYIGVLGLEKPVDRSALYGGVGLDVRVAVALHVWLRFRLSRWIKISLDFRFRFELGITAMLEVGVTGTNFLGARGRATIAIRAAGRHLHFRVHVGINEGAVNRAYAITQEYLHIGLEATEVEALPGTAPAIEEHGNAGGGGGASPEFAPMALAGEEPPPLDIDAERAERTFVCPNYSWVAVALEPEGDATDDSAAEPDLSQPNAVATLTLQRDQLASSSDPGIIGFHELNLVIFRNAAETGPNSGIHLPCTVFARWGGDSLPALDFTMPHRLMGEPDISRAEAKLISGVEWRLDVPEAEQGLANSRAIQIAWQKLDRDESHQMELFPGMAARRDGSALEVELSGHATLVFSIHTEGAVSRVESSTGLLEAILPL